MNNQTTVPRTVIVIPSRLGSTRLPNKPLADINGKPMIVQVVDRAIESGFSDVFVAAAEREIVSAVEAAGAKAVLTDPSHPSGTDRIWEALQKIEGMHSRFDVIINVQGDLPTIDPNLIKVAHEAHLASKADITTLAVRITEESEKTNPNVVKAIVAWARPANHGRGLYFTRATAPTGDAPLYHHIGLYVYSRESLERFVSLPPSPLELSEKLEQLRALEDGMKITVAEVDTVPLGVDTQADLERARALLTA
jgi:3-deoxy-manno-octulosonate cytidylyltransferase (CMP-KDO synthetase)